MPKIGNNVKTGTYTGDGGVAHAITGVGFAPIYVKIWNQTEAYETLQGMCPITYIHKDAAPYHAKTTAGDAQNGIRSLDADGFTVSDGGTDQSPNKDTYTYYYLALG